MPTNPLRATFTRVVPLLLLLAARRPASALDYDVDRIDDDATQTTCDPGTPNDCSLRGAILASNAHGGADQINLQALTYTLSITGTGEDAAATGDLDITDTLTIVGAGQSATIIDGDNIDRVIQTDPAGGGLITVTISELTIQHGQSPAIFSKNAEGGGIRNGPTALGVATAAGTLHLIDVTVDNNSSEKHGGGISNAGVLTVSNRLISSNVSGFLAGGAGIVQDDVGSLSVSGTTVRGNDADDNATQAGSGGGIMVGFFSTTAAPVVSIDESTISGNFARTAGGFQRIRGTVTMRNVTISGNTATQSSGDGGGGIGDLGFTNGLQPTMTVVSATITNNVAGTTNGGGGISAGGAGTRISNTIIAGNTGNGTPSDIIGTRSSRRGTI